MVRSSLLLASALAFSAPALAQTQPAPPPSTDAQNDNTSQPGQDSQPMNDVLRQLFNRSQN